MTLPIRISLDPGDQAPKLSKIVTSRDTKLACIRDRTCHRSIFNREAHPDLSAKAQGPITYKTPTALRKIEQRSVQTSEA